MTHPKPLPLQSWQFIPNTTSVPADPPRPEAQHPIGRIVRFIAEWPRRAGERERLRELPDYLLRDIGISREQAVHEASKPF